MFGGHALYCQKQLRGDEIDGELSRMDDGIVIPAHVADWCYTVTVLGWGPNVGKRCTQNHAYRYDRPRHGLLSSLKVGDTLLCPEGRNDGIRASHVPGHLGRDQYDEYYIEESVPLLRIGD